VHKYAKINSLMANNLTMTSNCLVRLQPGRTWTIYPTIKILNWENSRQAENQKKLYLCVHHDHCPCFRLSTERFHHGITEIYKQLWCMIWKLCLDDSFSDSLLDKLQEKLPTEQISQLRNDSTKVTVAYLADIFGKLNAFNLTMQGDVTYLACKHSIDQFLKRWTACRLQLHARNFEQFDFLNVCTEEVSDGCISSFTDHI